MAEASCVADPGTDARIFGPYILGFERNSYALRTHVYNEAAE